MASKIYFIIQRTVETNNLLKGIKTIFLQFKCTLNVKKKHFQMRYITSKNQSFFSVIIQNGMFRNTSIRSASIRSIHLILHSFQGMDMLLMV